MDNRNRLLQHAAIALHHNIHQGQYPADIRVIGNMHRKMELPNLSIVMQYLAHHAAIGYHHQRCIGVAQGGVEQRDGFHTTFLLRNGDVFAHAKWPREDDGQPRHDVAQHTLHGQRQTRARHAQAGDHRQQLNAQVLQRHDGKQQYHHYARNRGQQLARRRLQPQLLEQTRRRARHPARHIHADHQDHYRRKQPGPKFHRQFNGSRLNFLQGIDIVFHSYPPAILELETDFTICASGSTALARNLSTTRLRNLRLTSTARSPNERK